jgi:glutaredoxin
MSDSELYIAKWCSACHTALIKLSAAGYQFAIVDLDGDDALQKAFKVWEQRLGHNPNSIPQFWYQGEYIGGSTAIDKFLKEENVN